MNETINLVGWFEIPVNNFDRAVKFYQDVFNIKFEIIDGPKKMAFFPRNEETYGTGGALAETTDGFVPSEDGIMLYFTPPDINAILDKIEKAGGKKLSEKTSVGEFGFVGYFMDCEGNRLALHSDE